MSGSEATTLLPLDCQRPRQRPVEFPKGPSVSQMAPLPDVHDVLQIGLQWNDGTGQWGSRFFMQYGAAAPDADDLTNYCDDIAAAWDTNLAPLTANDYTLVQVTAEDLTSDTNASGQWTGSHVGTDSSDPLPSNVSADIQFVISYRHRGGHPVLHHAPGGVTRLATARQYATSYQTDLAASWNDFIAAISTDSHIPGDTLAHVAVLGHRNPPPSSGVQIFPVNSYRLRATVGTMRRRARLPR